MSSKSKKSDPADRPFSKADLKQAKKIAKQYQIVLNFEDGEWYGHSLEMPRVFADGTTPGKCTANLQEALTAAVATLLEAGQAPPIPSREGKRTEQVNIRVSAEEKALLETRAQQRGFRGLSDFVRTAALAD